MKNYLLSTAGEDAMAVVARHVLAVCRDRHEPGMPGVVAMVDLRWLRRRLAAGDWIEDDAYRLRWLAGAVGVAC